MIFGSSALLYAAAAVLLLGMRGRFRSEQVSAAPLRTDITEGLRYLWNQRLLRSMAASAGLANLANAAYFAVFPLWAVGEGSRIGFSPSGYGLVMTVLAIGAVGGSLLVARAVPVFGEGRLLVAVEVINVLMLLVPVLVPQEWALYPAFLLLGATSAATNVLVVSIRQRIVPGEVFGRVNSVYRLIGMGGMPLGAAAGGLLGELAGLPVVFYASVTVCLIAVLVIWRQLPRIKSTFVTSEDILPDISRSR